MAAQNELIITGARQHNLKNINLRIPHDQLFFIPSLPNSLPI
jgi:excinuclease UvrABC ATPase subunit